MKYENEKIKKQSYISFFFSYCIYFYDIRLIHLLIDEITQLRINTVYHKNCSVILKRVRRLTPNLFKYGFLLPTEV